MKISNQATRLGLLSLSIGVTVLAGCYIVPIDHSRYPVPGSATGPVVVQAPPPTSATFSARLYPSNDLATTYGMVLAQVTSDLNGKGAFTTVISGESFMGEATRTAGGSRAGIANGSGNRGSYISCRYQMNTATLGTGQCKLSNGAEFSMHVGN
jgi:hypothetical protein